MLEHCTATYGPTTEWLGTLDVDEFLSVSSQLYGADEPYLSTSSDSDSSAAAEGTIFPPSTLYPLHDILSRPQLADAACIPLPSLSFRNTGVRELKKGQGVLETQSHRDVLKQGKKLMREEGLQQKVRCFFSPSFFHRADADLRLYFRRHSSTPPSPTNRPSLSSVLTLARFMARPKSSQQRSRTVKEAFCKTEGSTRSPSCLSSRCPSLVRPLPPSFDLLSADFLPRRLPSTRPR
jgi:hypothetical protein